MGEGGGIQCWKASDDFAQLTHTKMKALSSRVTGYGHCHCLQKCTARNITMRYTIQPIQRGDGLGVLQETSKTMS